MKVYVGALACEQRQLETQKIINYFRLNNIELVQESKNSNYAIFVTCAVDSSSEKASLAKLDEIASGIGPETKLIIGGCLPSISPEKIKKYKIYETFSPKNIDEKIGELFNKFTNISFSDIDEPNKSIFDNEHELNYAYLSPRDEYDFAKQGFKIRINDGCLQHCSYCKIKDATGNLRSKSPELILKEVQKANEEKEKTIMFMGGDTGAYGYDIGTRLYVLLEETAKIQNQSQLFIHDFNINWLIKDFNKYVPFLKLNETDKKLRAVNFPIQSGSNKILKSMKRNYCSEQVTSVLKEVKEINPWLLLGTHIIVGFPDETKADFDSTLKLINTVPFDFLTCFLYYEHPSANSAKLQNKIHQKIIDSRLNQIQQIAGGKVKIIR